MRFPHAIVALAPLLCFAPLAGAQKLDDHRLAERLVDERAETRRRAAIAAGSMGDRAVAHVPALVALLADQEFPVALAASQACGHLGDVAAGALYAAAGRLEGRACVLTAAALARMGRVLPQNDRARVVAAIEASWSDPAAPVRREAVRAAGALDDPGDRLLLALFEADHDKAAIVRQQSGRSLHALGGRVITRLERLLKAKKIAATIRVVEIVSPHGAPALPLLAALAQSTPPEVRRAALAAIGQQCAAARAAQPLLERACTADDPAERAAAVEALGKVCDRDAPVPARLAAAARDGDARVRAAAFAGLGDFLGSDEEALLGPLGEALADSDAGVRRRAAERLAQMSSSLPSFAPRLVADLAVPENRDAAARAVVRCGPAAVEPLRQAVRSEDPAVAAAALEALGQLGWSDAEAVPTAVRFLKSSDPELRASAMRALGGLGASGAPAVPTLVRLLRKKNEQALAAETLGRIGKPAQDAAPRLLPLLGSRDPIVRRHAALALRSFPATGKKALPKLLRLTRDPDMGWAAYDAIAHLRLGSSQVVRALARNIQDNNAPHRIWAIWALGWFGADAKRAFPALVVVARGDADAGVRTSAIGALPGVGSASQKSEEVLQLLIEFASDDHDAVRLEAIRALGWFSARPEAEPVLVAQLESAHRDERLAAIQALSRTSVPRPAHAVEVFTAALRDSDREIREAAAIAVARSGDDGREILAAGLQDPSPAMRRAAVFGMAVLEEPPASVIPALLDIGEARDSRVREQVAVCLARIDDVVSELGKHAGSDRPARRRIVALAAARLGKAALRLLQRLAEDSDPVVRMRAAAALRAIE